MLPKVFLSSDSPFNLDAIEAILNKSSEVALKGKAILHELHLHPSSIDFDILVLDVCETTEIDELKHIFHFFDDKKILVVTASNNQFFLTSLLHMGAQGCFVKTSPASELISAINDLQKNNAYLPASLFYTLYCELPTKFNSGVQRHIEHTHQDVPILDIDSLTHREKEIVKLIVAGESSPKIAKELFISEMTVNTHRKHIFKKLGVNNASTLIRCALEQGLK